MFTDIQVLNKFKDDQFDRLIEIALTFLIEPTKSSRLLAQVDEFAEQNGVGPGALKNVFKSLLVFLNSALRQNLSPSQLQDDFQNLGLSDTKTNNFCEQWKVNIVNISRSALSQTLMVNQLVDMEWKFGVTAASSEVDKVGNTFLQLKLVINNGTGTSNVYMELTLPQFYSFLHEMSKARASLEFLS